MKLVHLITISLFVAAMSFGACNKPGGVGCTSSLTRVSDASSAFSTAASNYSADQSPANCRAYVKAYDEYLDAYEKYFKKCAGPGYTKEQLESIREARDEFKENNPC